ncbi:MAG: hypothetical protein HFG22_08635 [Lachnospiraceae bacterium]|nr:hypothetical protein [Lachnospiraceae bacterium]
MKDKIGVIAGALCLALMMGLYRSYLGCVTLVVLVVLSLMSNLSLERVATDPATGDIDNSSYRDDRFGRDRFMEKEGKRGADTALFLGNEHSVSTIGSEHCIFART